MTSPAQSGPNAWPMNSCVSFSRSSTAWEPVWRYATSGAADGNSRDRITILLGPNRMTSALDQCPICGFRRINMTAGDGKTTFTCNRCGEYDISSAALDLPQQ